MSEEIIEIPGFDSMEKIGEGGMATVWKARQISLDRTVAIKVLFKSLAATPADAARFQDEARAAAKIKHPGIVQVYDAQVYEGMYYFVMEYVAGYSVGDWIRRKKVLPESESLLAIECVADALGDAWDTQAIVHCDIKPDNIMIDADGTIKVADLGLSRSIGALSQMEDEDDVMGTPNYMSPEQIQGEPDLDCATDIYSLGATLYQMVTGVMLFADIDEMEVMEQQLSGQVVDPIELNPSLSMGVCWLIEKMLSKDREDRYSDWKSVLADISQVKRGTMLLGPLPILDASTVARSPDRTRPPRRRAVPSDSGRLRSLITAGVIIIVIAALAVIGIRLTAKQQRIRTVLKPPPTVKKVDKTAAARKIYRAAFEALAARPDKYDVAIRDFARVAKRTAGTKYSGLAWKKIAELERTKQEAIDSVIAELREKAGKLVADRQFDKAVDMYLNYLGKMDSETLTTRRELAAVVRDRKKEHIESKGNDAERRATAVRVALSKTAARIVSDGVLAARKQLEKAIKNDEYLRRDDKEVNGLAKLLKAACDLDGDLLDTFRHQVGRSIIVRMRYGRRAVTIARVIMDTVHAKEKVRKGTYTVDEPVEFKLRDLSPVETLQRLGQDDSPANNLRKGCAAAEAKAMSSAKNYFSKLPNPLRDLLRKAMEE